MLGWMRRLLNRHQASSPNRRVPVLDYHISLTLPEEIMAIVRTTWYDPDGRPAVVDEMVIMEDNDEGQQVFAHVIATGIQQGANISVRASYQPQELGIFV